MSYHQLKSLNGGIYKWAISTKRFDCRILHKQGPSLETRAKFNSGLNFLSLVDSQFPLQKLSPSPNS